MAGSNPHGLTPWKRLKILLKPEKADIWILLIYGGAAGVLSLVVPVTAQAIVNTAAFGTVLQPLLVLAVVVFSLLLIAGGLRVVQAMVAERIQQRIFARMAIDLSHRLPRVQMRTYDEQRGTELVNRFLDVATIQKGVAMILQEGFAIVLQALIGMVLLALYSPFLLGFALLLFVSMAFILFVLGRGAIKTSVEESEAKYEVTAWLEELARVPLTFRSASAERLALREGDKRTQKYLSAREKHFSVLVRQITGSLLLQAVASGLVLGIGGWLVTRQQLSLGQLVAAELIVTPLVGSFASFGKYLENFYDLLAGVEKVGHLFDLPLEHVGRETLQGIEGPAAIRIRNVQFAHDGVAVPVFNELSTNIDAGSRVVVTGSHGSGKTSFSDLITGLRLPQSGVVDIDGIDLREVSPNVLHEQIALVRGVQLFDGTILDNIRVGRDLDRQEINRVLQQLGLYEELTFLPEGLQTHLNGAHLPLSNGQATRLLFARAIINKPRLIVVDESLDNLSEETRQKVLDVLLQPEATWTLVVLTQHVDEVGASFDRVLTLGNGRVMTDVSLTGGAE